jgi:hypothetical protein
VPEKSFVGVVIWVMLKRELVTAKPFAVHKGTEYERQGFDCGWGLAMTPRTRIKLCPYEVIARYSAVG